MKSSQRSGPPSASSSARTRSDGVCGAVACAPPAECGHDRDELDRGLGEAVFGAVTTAGGAYLWQPATHLIVKLREGILGLARCPAPMCRRSGCTICATAPRP